MVTTPGYDMELGLDNWNGYIGDGVVNNGPKFTDNPILNEWVHLAVIRDAPAGRMRCYTNGKLVNEQVAPAGSVSSTRPLDFGSASGNNQFRGKIDDIRIYNRAISADEVAAIHAGR